MAETVDVVVVGAGLAGLTAARDLLMAGRTVVLLESGDAPGGRVRTDTRDGMLLDRGFQLFNPSYPAAQKVFDIAALDLRPFRAGVAVAVGEQRHVLADPRRWPGRAVGTALAPVGSLREKLAFLRYAVRVGLGPVGTVKTSPDGPLRESLARQGLSGELTRRVLVPFLAGVLAEDALETSRRFGDLLVRSFVRGTPSLPSTGMRALPDQLAAALPQDVLRLNTTARSVRPGAVSTDDGDLHAGAIVLAADPVTTCRLLGRPAPTMRALTTFYHRADVAPTEHALLHVDGDRRGPLINSAVVSNAAPSYTTRGALVASTVLGADGGDEMARLVREQAGLVYGVDSRAWEHVATYVIPGALPAMPPPLALQRPVALGDGLFVAGDHVDTASIQGALVSGRRAAEAVLSR